MAKERNRDRLLKSSQPYSKTAEDEDPQVHPWERPDRLSTQDPHRPQWVAPPA